MVKNEDGFVVKKVEVRRGNGKWLQVRFKGKDGKMKCFIMHQVESHQEVKK
jgi:hypothetical protein